jgi:hypothetical protein
MKPKKSKIEDVPMSPALSCIQAAYEAMPYNNSRERYRHGMWNILRAAVVSNMRFAPDDFAKMKNPGSWCGAEGHEGLYALACGSDRLSENTSAAIALENWMERPAVLWAEQTRTAQRLYVGARFTWQGQVVTITSMQADHLIACTYKPRKTASEDGEGQSVYFVRQYRQVLKTTPGKDGTVTVKLGADGDREDNQIDRRFRVSYSELTKIRKAYDDRRRGYEKRFEKAETLVGVELIAAEAVKEGRGAYRHFDVEMLQEARSAADKRIKAAAEALEEEASRAKSRAAYEAQNLKMAESHDADLERWLRGEELERGWFGFKVIRVRFKDGRIETTNGHDVTIASAKKLIPFVLIHREKGWTRPGNNRADGPMVDLHPVNHIDAEGVQIGCTLFPWSEVDRLIPLLRKA